MRRWGWLAAVAMIVPISAGAENLEEQVADLRSQVALLTARLEQLEGSTVAEEHLAAAPGQDRRTERIKVKGDFRYRHDYIDVEGVPSRNRDRIRARIGLFAQIRDDLESGLQLASGPNSPVTTNQTLGNAASTKDIRLDLAYVRWDLPFEGFTVTGGKFKNPLYRPATLIWDDDVNPEGIAVHYAEGDLFATAMAFWTVERSTEDDSMMLTGQVGWRHQFEHGPGLLLGTSFYENADIRGRAPLFDGLPRGNSVDANGDYRYGFRQVEVFAETDLSSLKVPLTLFGHYVKNLDAGSQDRAYAIGAQWTPLSRWELAYSYRNVDADSVIGDFTESDFGLGITGAKGHIVASNFHIADGVGMKMTYFRSEAGGAASGIDVNRAFVDFSFKY